MLKLRSAPVTVVASLFSLFGWLLTTMTVQAVGSPGVLLGLPLLLVVSIVSLVLTSIAIRPLAPIFASKHAEKADVLVGKIAVVSTGEVTTSFGQATYEGGGQSLTLQIRSDGTSPLARGDRVVLVAWDERLNVFHVERLPSHDDVLLHREDARAEAEALRELEAELDAAKAGERELRKDPGEG